MNRLVELWRGDVDLDVDGALRKRAGPRGGELQPIGKLLEGVVEHLHDVRERKRAQVRALFVDNPRPTLDQLKAGRLANGPDKLTEDDVAQLVEIIAQAMWDEQGRYLCMVKVWLRDARRRHKGNRDLQPLFEAVDSALVRGNGEQLEQCTS
ncbi:MAG: hypothetical protein KDD66_10410 [Bdellovibrionales bacterium]|nr:hypothetical protein [Bdellovibrionales bacterium]